MRWSAVRSPEAEGMKPGEEAALVVRPESLALVAAESNFVLHLALEQEEGAEARSILDLAASGQIRLVIPACALFEPYEPLFRRHRCPHNDRAQHERNVHKDTVRPYPTNVNTRLTARAVAMAVATAAVPDAAHV